VADERDTRGTIRVLERRIQADFDMLPTVIRKRHDISLGAKVVYATLMTYYHRFEAIFPGQETLAEDVGSSERSVRRYLQELRDVGLLLIERRGLGLTNEYVLLEWADSGAAAKMADPERSEPAHPERPDRPHIPIKKKEGNHKQPVARRTKSDRPEPPEDPAAYRAERAKLGTR
jgi:hypothetical protein